MAGNPVTLNHTKLKRVVVGLLSAVRYWFVKLIAPKVYEGHLKFEQKFFRPMFEAIKSSGQKNLVGVEIGVSEGHNSQRILEQLDVMTLYLVDPYLPYIDADGTHHEPTNRYEQAKRRLAKYGNKVVFIKKCSADAVSMLPKLDFVYIDGNHNYECVKEDIQNYYPLVKENGFFGGHDFFGTNKGVILAVTEFVKDEGLELNSDSYDWWVIKPNKSKKER